MTKVLEQVIHGECFDENKSRFVAYGGAAGQCQRDGPARLAAGTGQHIRRPSGPAVHEKEKASREKVV
jgi:hypothetical protein